MNTKDYVFRIYPKFTKIINIKKGNEIYLFENASKIIIDNIEKTTSQIIDLIMKQYPTADRITVKSDIVKFKNKIKKYNINKNNIEDKIIIDDYSNNYPKYCVIEIINNCCFACKHCYIPKEKSCIKINDYKKIIDELSNLGCNEILLTGGEPMLHKNFMEFYLYAKKKGFLISINSNLFKLTPSIMKMFIEYKPRLVEVSLYGYDEKSYKNFTGVSNSYNVVIKNIKKLLNEGINVGTKTVLTQSNKNFFFEIQNLAKKLNLPFRYDYIIFPKLDEKNANEERLSPSEIVNIIKRDKAATKQLKSEVTNLPFVTTSSNLVFQCSAGKDRLFIDSELNVKPCLLLPIKNKYSKHSLKNTLLNFNKYKENFKFKNNKCAKCSKKKLCRYCPGRFFMETNDFQKAPKFYCDLADKIIDEFKQEKINMFNNILTINNNILFELYKIIIDNHNIIYNETKEYDTDEFSIWKKNISKDENYRILTYNSTNIIGFLSFTLIDARLWISEVQIKKEFQNKGILKKLIREFLMNINNDNDSVYIHINSKNTHSKKVFEKIGFKEEGNTIYKIDVNSLKKWALENSR